MNTLLIDAGNTHIKLASIDERGQNYRDLGRCHTQADPQTLGMWINTQSQTCSRAVGVCVAGEAVRASLVSVLRVPVQWLASDTPLLGLRNDYDSPQSLGSDRWMAAYGALKSRPPSKRPFILATFGTATTIDLVYWDATQQCHVFAGGIIIAGLTASWRILAQSTAQLPDVTEMTLANPINGIPNSTHSALQLGAIYAQVGAVNHFISVATRSFGVPDLCLAGGAVKHMVSHFSNAQLLESPVLLGLAFSNGNRLESHKI